MKKVILISACKTKSDTKGFAKDLYIGQFSAKAYKYATKIEHDAIFFLSTVFHVVEPNQEVQKVNIKFTDMKNKEKREWAEVVMKQLSEKGINIETDNLVFFTPKDYWQWIVEKMHNEGKNTGNFEMPLLGLTQGKQICWISDRLKEIEK